MHGGEGDVIIDSSIISLGKRYMLAAIANIINSLLYSILICYKTCSNTRIPFLSIFDLQGHLHMVHSI